MLILQFFEFITSNYIINVGFVSWCVAQILKTIFATIKYKAFIPERLVGAGGMPSSHTALVISVVIAMAKLEGFSSPAFALSVALAGIVIYDAMGVRRAAGEQAKVLNKMMFSFKDIKNIFESLGREVQTEYNEKTEDVTAHKELKEFLGHTPLEVLGGAVVGIVVASLMPIK